MPFPFSLALASAGELHYPRDVNARAVHIPARNRPRTHPPHRHSDPRARLSPASAVRTADSLGPGCTSFRSRGGQRGVFSILRAGGGRASHGASTNGEGAWVYVCALCYCPLQRSAPYSLPFRILLRVPILFNRIAQ